MAMTITLEAADFQVLDAKGPAGPMKVLVFTSFDWDPETGQNGNAVMRINIPILDSAAHLMGSLLKGETPVIVPQQPQIHVARPGERL